MRFRKFGQSVALLIVTAMLLTIPFAWRLYVLNVAVPASLKSAGEVEIGDMHADVSISSILPEPHQPGNAFVNYVQALNEYNARRRLYRNLPKIQRVTDEPIAGPRELFLFAEATAIKNFEPIAKENDSVPPIITVDGKSWRYDYQDDPYGTRPEIAPMRLLTQAILNEGKKSELQNDRLRAEKIYRSVLRMGNNWRSQPLSMMDLQLGLEIETRACHYLEMLFAPTDQQRTQLLTYSKSLNRLNVRIGRKYRQLDTLAAAKFILEHDNSRLWRTEALSSLYAGLFYHRVSWPERAMVNDVLKAVKRENRFADAVTIDFLQRMKPIEFHNPGTEQTAKNQRKGAGS